MIEKNTSGIGLIGARHELKECGLASTIWAHDGDTLFVMDAK
jgi:hypothetical protein